MNATMKHPATTSNTPRRYLIAATTTTKAAADLAAKDAAKAERHAATMERKAARAEKRAALLNTEEAADLAREARAAADLAATEAAAATITAATLARDPAAYIAATTIEARNTAEAHEAAALIFEKAVARGMLAPLATIRAHIDPRAAIEARAATEAPRAAFEAAKAAYLIAAEAHEANPTEATEAAKDAAAAEVKEARRALMRAEDAAEAAEAAALAEAPEAVARQVAKRATEREGTPTQWEIRKAAEARQHFDPDFFDMISAARVPLSVILYGDEATAADLEEQAAATLATAADPDPITRATITPATLAAARADQRAAAAIRAKLADPAAPFWILDAYRAAYLAVNDHLTACRAIRTATNPAPISLDDIDPSDPSFIVDFDPVAEAEAKARAATLRAAFTKTAAALTPTRRRVWMLAAKGYAVEAIAAKMNRHPKTIQEHMQAIRTAAAVTLMKDAADLAATLRAASIIEAAAMAESEASKARRAAAEAREAATEAARRAVLNGTPEAIKAATAAHLIEIKAGEAATAASIKAAEAPATEAAATLAAAVATLSPIRREIWARLAKGEGVREIAAAMRRHHSTIQEHVKAIRATLAAAMEATAPDLAEALKAADLATIAAAVQ